MAIRSAPFYWLECDGEGCGRRCPDDTWEEWVAWETEEAALSYALDSDWLITEDGRHLCPDCAAQEKAEVTEDEEQDEGARS